MINNEHLTKAVDVFYKVQFSTLKYKSAIFMFKLKQYEVYQHLL